MTTRLELANAQYAQGDYAAAIETAGKLLRLGQNLYEAHSLVGVSAMKMGDTGAARRAFEKAVGIKPGQEGGWSNLMLLAIELHDHELAKTCLRRLMVLQPENGKYPVFLAGMFMETGEIEACRQAIGQALRVAPRQADAWWSRFELETQFTPAEQWPALWQQLAGGPGLTPRQACLMAQVKMMHAWLCRMDADDYQKIFHEFGESANGLLRYHAENAAASLPEQRRRDAITENVVKGYLVYFDRLKPYAPPPAETPALPRLYMVGDSHVLAPHGQTAQVEGTEYQIESSLTVGCKLWHLARPRNNLWRQVFEAALARLPGEGVFILSIGEIDCRPDEGIWPAAQSQGESWQTLLERTVDPAVAWLAARRGGRRFILSGVPVPSRHQMAKLPEAQRPEYRRFVAAANEALKNAALAHGMGFVDLQAFTADGFGGPRQELYLDAVHLLPGVFPDALTQALVVVPAQVLGASSRITATLPGERSAKH